MTWAGICVDAARGAAVAPGDGTTVGDDVALSLSLLQEAPLSLCVDAAHGTTVGPGDGADTRDGAANLAPLRWPLVPFHSTAVPLQRTCLVQVFCSSLCPASTMPGVSDAPHQPSGPQTLAYRTICTPSPSLPSRSLSTGDDRLHTRSLGPAQVLDMVPSGE